MYVPDDKTLANPGVFGFVTGAISTITGAVSGAQSGRVERNIQERMKQWASFTDDRLRSILPDGGERAEAARRLLQSRGAPLTAPSPPSVTLTAPSFNAAGIPGWILPVGILTAGMVLLAGRRR